MRVLTYHDLKPEKGIPHSRSQIDRLVADGKFPRPGKQGGRTIWFEDEIDQHLADLRKRRDEGKDVRPPEVVRKHAETMAKARAVKAKRRRRSA